MIYYLFRNLHNSNCKFYISSDTNIDFYKENNDVDMHILSFSL